MGIFSKRKNEIIADRPFPGEIEEAKGHANGWVYRIAGTFSDDEIVPPEAIVGAWEVDSNGSITGQFKSNPKYDKERWPPRAEEGQT